MERKKEREKERVREIKSERKRERKKEIQHPSLCFRWAGGNEVLSILSGREKAGLCFSPLG